MTTSETISAIERRHHDRHASGFDTKKLLRRMKDHAREELWKEVLPLLRGKTALDIGCGLGFDSVLLARLGFLVTAIDISPLSIGRAKLLASFAGVEDRCSFNVVDLNVESVDGQYDVVFGRAVLHHLTLRPLAETLGSLRGNLHTQGRMIFIEPLDKNPAVLINRKFLDPYDRTPTEKPLNLVATLRAFRDASLDVTHREYYLTSTLAYFFRNAIRYDSAFRSSKRGLTGVDRMLMRLFPPLRRYAWISLIVGQRHSSWSVLSESCHA